MSSGLALFLVGMIVFCLFTGSRLRATSDSKSKNTFYTSSLYAWSILSVLGLLFTLLMLLVGGLDGDADQGTLEIYKTPLGGGYYLLSRMNDSDLPLPLKHLNAERVKAVGEDNLVQGLLCSAGQTYLKFEGSYGRINLQKRALERIAEKDLSQTLKGSPIWTSKYSFLATPCAKVGFTQHDLWLNAQTYLAVPSFIILSLLALLTWGRRISNVSKPLRPT